MEEKDHDRRAAEMEEMEEMEEMAEFLNRRNAGPPPSRGIAGVRGHSPRAQASSLTPAESPLRGIATSVAMRSRQ